MNVKNNKRHQTTMDNINSALIALLQDKSLQEISVTDVCEKAEINRSTFYESFKDLSALAKVASANIEKTISNEPHSTDSFSWLFEFIKENKEMFTAYFKLGVAEIEADYKTIFFRNGVYSVAKLWFEGGCKDNPKQMGEIVKVEYKKCFNA